MTVEVYVVARKGVGEVRHLDTNMLWVQEKAARKEIIYGKVKGVENPADLMTKGLAIVSIEKHCKEMNMEFTEGRSAIAPQVASCMLKMTNAVERNKSKMKCEDKWKEDSHFTNNSNDRNVFRSNANMFEWVHDEAKEWTRIHRKSHDDVASELLRRTFRHSRIRDRDALTEPWRARVR